MTWGIVGLCLIFGVPVALVGFKLTKTPKRREYWAEDYDVRSGPRDDFAP